MKNFWLGSIALLFVQIALAELPKAQGTLVNDFANVLTIEQRHALENNLRVYEKQTGVEIALVTVPNIDGYGSIEEYANQLFHQWGIGKKGADNGVLILNAIAERKYRIELGYGVEGFLTDYDAGKIIQIQAIPHLKAGDYLGAYTATIEAVKGKIGSMTPEERAVWKQQHEKAVNEGSNSGQNDGFIGIIIFLGFLVIAGIVAVFFSKSKHKYEENQAEENTLVPLPVDILANAKTPRTRTRKGKGKKTRTRTHDDDSLATGIAAGAIASSLSHDDDDDNSSSSSSSSDSDSGSSFDFGGGDSGGGGATGSY